MTVERTATCACGQLKIRLRGEPVVVSACNCLECQKRTGSAFGIGAFFRDDQVIDKSGERARYARSSDAGRSVEFCFCPNCGSTVYWKAEFLEGRTGVAAGCFADPGFPEPRAVAWDATQHGWLEFPERFVRSAAQDFKKS